MQAINISKVLRQTLGALLIGATIAFVYVQLSLEKESCSVHFPVYMVSTVPSA